jgi:hypothetical protein
MKGILEDLSDDHSQSYAKANRTLDAGRVERCFALPATAGQIEALSKLLPSKSDAAAEAALVVGGFQSGTRAVLDACARTNEALQRFPDDNPELIDAFLAVLVEGNIVSRSEARLGKASPKLSKFKTIGQHAEILRDERVFCYLPPAYSVIYQATVLYSLLEGNEAHRLDQLVRELAALSPLSRERLAARTEEIKRAKKGVSALPSIADAGDHRADGDVNPIGSIGTDYKLVLLTPDRARDLGRLSDDAEDPDFVHLGRELLAEDAVAVVVARLADIPLIESRLLPILGFSFISRVCLIRIPPHADVTAAEVIIFAHREETVFAATFKWVAEGDAFDARSAVEALLPEGGRKLHLFAEESDGSSGEWLSVVGDANWGQSDE